MFNRGQGTIEYLMIIAIIVVISLVVVGLVITQVDNSSNVTSTSSEIATKIGVNGLSLASSVAGVDENGLLVIKNIDVENLTLSKIVVDGVDHNFSTQIVANDEKSFKLQDIASCVGEKKSYSVQVEYISASGLNKVSDFGNISLDCTSVVTPAKVAVEEIISNVVPSVELSSPVDEYSDTETRVSFVFVPSDSDGAIESCSLNLTDLMDANSSSSIVVDEDNILEYTLSVGSYDWNISCTDDDGDTNTSETRTLSIESNLIAHYLMNDNAASTVILDTTGNYNGVTALSNTSTLTTTGKLNSALSFINGTRNYANLSSVKDVFSGTNDWTIALWEKNSSASYHMSVFSITNNNLYTYYNKDSHVLSYGYPWSNMNSSFTLVANTWYHFVFMRRNGTFSYYKDGLHFASEATNSNLVDISSSIFSVGGVSNAAQETYYDYSTRTVDDVRIYNKALSQDEIDAIYNGGIGTEAE